MLTLRFPREWKNAAFISIAFRLDFFYQKWKYHFWGMQNKKLFEIILSELQALKVGWLTQSNKSCHGLTLINEFSSFDYPSNFESL